MSVLQIRQNGLVHDCVYFAQLRNRWQRCLPEKLRNVFLTISGLKSQFLFTVSTLSYIEPET